LDLNQRVLFQKRKTYKIKSKADPTVDDFGTLPEMSAKDKMLNDFGKNEDDSDEDVLESKLHSQGDIAVGQLKSDY
jgi:hypothetical protein